MNQMSDMLFRYFERLKKTVNSENALDYIDSQARDIIESIRDQIQKYLLCMNIFKAFKIHTGIKKMKSDDNTHEQLIGDLNQDAKYLMQHTHGQKTLKGIFLKEKITSNTVIRKIKDIILLFEEKYHETLLKEFENLLGYKVDVL